MHLVIPGKGQPAGVAGGIKFEISQVQASTQPRQDQIAHATIVKLLGKVQQTRQQMQRQQG
jgi:hypothetical protein